MQMTYLVTAEVERVEGKFASRDELSEQIRTELEGADPGSLDGDAGGEYSVESFEVEEVVIERGRELMTVTAVEREMIEARRARRGGKS